MKTGFWSQMRVKRIGLGLLIGFCYILLSFVILVPATLIATDGKILTWIWDIPVK